MSPKQQTPKICSEPPPHPHLALGPGACLGLCSRLLGSLHPPGPSLLHHKPGPACTLQSWSCSGLSFCLGASQPGPEPSENSYLTFKTPCKCSCP